MVKQHPKYDLLNNIGYNYLNVLFYINIYNLLDIIVYLVLLLNYPPIKYILPLDVIIVLCPSGIIKLVLFTYNF